MAMTINPEISLARFSNLFTVMEKISGKILEAANPVENMKTNAIPGVVEKIKTTIVIKVAIADCRKNLEAEYRVRRIVPKNVPTILPKK